MCLRALLPCSSSWATCAARIAWLFWFGAICALSAAAGAHYDAFWTLVSFGVLTLWAIIAGLGVIDIGWRMRFGLVVSVCTLAFIALWPTLFNMSKGKLPLPRLHS